jgi:hypothetical protein
MIELQGSRIDDTTGGNSGIERRVSLMYTRWCTQPRQVAGALCIHMAKIMGMYPRKGALAVGSDAGIVVLDTNLQKTIRAADLHETDYTPWEWARRDGLAQRLLRGKVIVEGWTILRRPEGRSVPAAQGSRRDSRPAVRRVLSMPRTSPITQPSALPAHRRGCQPNRSRQLAHNAHPRLSRPHAAIVRSSML